MKDYRAHGHVCPLLLCEYAFAACVSSLAHQEAAQHLTRGDAKENQEGNIFVAKTWKHSLRSLAASTAQLSLKFEKHRKATMLVANQADPANRAASPRAVRLVFAFDGKAKHAQCRPITNILNFSCT